MNWQHLRTIAWLRWRLTVNQWRKGGKINAVVSMIVAGVGAVASVAALFVGILVGVLLFPRMQADSLLFMWDILVLAFLFFWLMGVITDLQRSEVLSLDKLMHLPVSLGGAFLLNYFSSWLSLSLVLFLFSTLGLSIALVFTKGLAMLVLFPLVISFVLMITAVTHQFREWLNLLMVNKRRRRAIIMAVTASFILLAQLPNLINVFARRSASEQGPDARSQVMTDLQTRLNGGEIDQQQYTVELAEWETKQAAEKAADRQRTMQTVTHVAVVANRWLPIGWLPYGSYTAANGSMWPGLLGSVGALVLGAVCLRRSYASTLRFYTGGYSTGERKRSVPVAKHSEAKENFLERKIRWVPEPAAAVAVGTFRSLTRSPEGKMLLLVPLILTGVFGSMFFAGGAQRLPDEMRPFLGFGVIGITVLSFSQLMYNLFGVDREGFRAYVLSPVPRSYILLGKNLAIAPLGLGISCLTLAVLQILRPMAFSHVLATLLQSGIVFLLTSLLGNFVSILVPSPNAIGSLKPAQAKGMTILVHLLATFLSPLLLVPAGAGIGLEMLLDHFEIWTWFPLYLIVSVLELVCVVWVYRQGLVVLGRWLRTREQLILEVVSKHTQ